MSEEKKKKRKKERKEKDFFLEEFPLVGRADDSYRVL